MHRALLHAVLALPLCAPVGAGGAVGPHVTGAPARRDGAAGERVLDGNSLDDLSVLRAPRAVVAHGRAFDAAALEAIRAELRADGRGP